MDFKSTKPKPPWANGIQQERSADAPQTPAIKTKNWLADATSLVNDAKHITELNRAAIAADATTLLRNRPTDAPTPESTRLLQGTTVPKPSVRKLQKDSSEEYKRLS